MPESAQKFEIFGKKSGFGHFCCTPKKNRGDIRNQLIEVHRTIYIYTAVFQEIFDSFSTLNYTQKPAILDFINSAKG